MGKYYFKKKIQNILIEEKEGERQVEGFDGMSGRSWVEILDQNG